MPKDPIAIKTIVTTDMAKAIAEHYGVDIIEVLTGFKFIGEQILFLEEKGQENRYIFGFEESYGYLSGGYVRDKDAVDGVFMIVEMFSYYKTHGISLLDKLEELYKKYGHYSNYLKSYEFEGSSGLKKMKDIMDYYRQDIKDIGGRLISNKKDYSLGIEGLPKSNVIKMYLDDGSTVVLRPSGTEPKLKIYLSILGDNESSNIKKRDLLFKDLEANL